MSSATDLSAADRNVLLSKAWLERGRADLARRSAERALQSEPDHAEAHRALAYAMVCFEDMSGALQHLRVAQRGLPPDPTLAREIELLAGLAGEAPRPPSPLAAAGQGKLRFRSFYDGSHQRSGWAFGLAALGPLCSEAGTLFEPFLEDVFAWQHPREGRRTGAELLRALRRPSYESRLTSEERNIVPFREPWVGALHNPPSMPSWFHYNESPQAIFDKRVWRDSLSNCRGFFVLSTYLGDWVRRMTLKPVSVLVLPTETPEVCFEFDRFLHNPQRRIVQIGWWLRSLNAIYRLPLATKSPLAYRKMRLVPRFFPGSGAYLRELMQRERQAMGWSHESPGTEVEEVEHLPDDEYDALLAANIVFLNLHDASANNTIVECIARATPLLVNRLPAVVEYLGPGYPLYYEHLSEAAANVMDLGRIRAAHEYLLECETRPKLGQDYFRRCLEDSEVYRSL